jgi:hypothetical protein
MPRPAIPINIGDRYGALRVVSEAGKYRHLTLYRVVCIHCGAESIVRSDYLRYGSIDGSRCSGCREKKVINTSSQVNTTTSPSTGSINKSSSINKQTSSINKHRVEPKPGWQVPDDTGYVPQHEADF